MIEALNRHMKIDGLMGRNWLECAMGDPIHATLCVAGQNLRLLLRAIADFLGFDPRSGLKRSNSLESLQPGLPREYEANALRLYAR